jgi:hypothetical protein
VLEGGGEYVFCDVVASDGGEVMVSSPSTLFVAGSLSVRLNSQVNVGGSPDDLRIVVDAKGKSAANIPGGSSPPLDFAGAGGTAASGAAPRATTTCQLVLGTRPLQASLGTAVVARLCVPTKTAAERLRRRDPGDVRRRRHRSKRRRWRDHAALYHDDVPDVVHHLHLELDDHDHPADQDQHDDFDELDLLHDQHEQLDVHQHADELDDHDRRDVDVHLEHGDDNRLDLDDELDGTLHDDDHLVVDLDIDLVDLHNLHDHLDLFWQRMLRQPPDSST